MYCDKGTVPHSSCPELSLSGARVTLRAIEYREVRRRVSPRCHLPFPLYSAAAVFNLSPKSWLCTLVRGAAEYFCVRASSMTPDQFIPNAKS